MAYVIASALHIVLYACFADADPLYTGVSLESLAVPVQPDPPEEPLTAHRKVWPAAEIGADMVI